MKAKKKYANIFIFITAVWLIASIVLLYAINNDTQSFSARTIKETESLITPIISKNYPDYYSIDTDSIKVDSNKVDGNYQDRSGNILNFTVTKQEISNKNDSLLYIYLFVLLGIYLFISFIMFITYCSINTDPICE